MSVHALRSAQAGLEAKGFIEVLQTLTSYMHSGIDTRLNLIKKLFAQACQFK